MTLALEQARIAASCGEVPVGAVVVRDGKVIATGHNALISGHDPTAHAEMVALRAASTILENYRLDECELFVTLEPCAMCSGAILNARLKRVVFGAAEPKTGAAGSVINLFSQTRLNHQTGWQGGVQAEACGALMQDFFRQRRLAQRASARLRHPLRDDALRTPDAAFDALPAYPWKPHYRSDLPALEGLRMHYLDEQAVPAEADTRPQPAAYLCLHAFSGWSFGFRQLIPSLIEAGQRVVVPDLIGFGKSDKPKKTAFHTLQRHHQVLVELVEALDLHDIVLVLAERQSLLGLTLPMAAPSRFRGLQLLDETGGFSGDLLALSEGSALWQQSMRLLRGQRVSTPPSPMNQTGSRERINADLHAPFPGQSYRAGVRAFSDMSAVIFQDVNLELMSRTERFWTP